MDRVIKSCSTQQCAKRSGLIVVVAVADSGGSRILFFGEAGPAQHKIFTSLINQQIMMIMHLKISVQPTTVLLHVLCIMHEYSNLPLCFGWLPIKSSIELCPFVTIKLYSSSCKDLSQHYYCHTP